MCCIIKKNVTMLMLYGCDWVALFRAHVIDEITRTSEKELVVHTRKHQLALYILSFGSGFCPSE